MLVCCPEILFLGCQLPPLLIFLHIQMKSLALTKSKSTFGFDDNSVFCIISFSLYTLPTFPSFLPHRTIFLLNLTGKFCKCPPLNYLPFIGETHKVSRHSIPKCISKHHLLGFGLISSSIKLPILIARLLLPTRMIWIRFLNKNSTF